jgi:hypothetical protein
MVDQLIDIKTDVFNKLDSDALATMLSPAMSTAIEDNIRKASNSNSNSNILAVYDTAQLYLPDITKQLTTSRVKGTITTITTTTTTTTSTTTSQL